MGCGTRSSRRQSRRARGTGPSNYGIEPYVVARGTPPPPSLGGRLQWASLVNGHDRARPAVMNRDGWVCALAIAVPRTDPMVERGGLLVDRACTITSTSAARIA